MTRKNLILLLILGVALLAAALGFVVHMETRQPGTTPETTVPSTEVFNAETTVPVTEAPATVPTTVAPTTEPVETEPQETRYTLTFTGDCTLGSVPGDFGSPHSFIGTVGEDYGFPFRNVLPYFENDDLTLINLESVLADSNQGKASKTFNFRGPTAYTEIMTGSSVEAVTLANNHSGDFGKPGYESTTNALTAAGIHYVEEDKTTLITTESGLVVGLYADAFKFSEDAIRKNVQSLRDQGAEIVICAFHWGNEGSYRPTAEQQMYGKAAIDAGADIVWGHHPHVLQKIEHYGDGVILYSLGNFSFGGNNYPRDLDSAIVQMEIIRDLEGNVRLGELTIIPVSITSLKTQNNFQPTPCEEGSERYERVLSKLDGSFDGPDLVVNYDHLKPTEPPTEEPGDTPTEAPSQDPTEAPGDAPTQAPPEEPPAQEPVDPPADTPDPT